jgi:hypothetical protein
VLAAALIVNSQIDVIVIKIMESETLLLVTSEGRGSSVDIWVLGEGVVRAMASMVSL